MNMQPKVRNTLLVGALAAVTATAWATNSSISSATYIPPSYVAVETTAPATAEPVSVSETLAPNESVVLVNDTEPAPVVERSVVQPAITVEDRRMSRDERIHSLVMDRLATSRNISGKIGVESQDAVVRLSGYTLTAAQAYRAGREAGSIEGVRYVQNEIRPRIGGSV